MSVLIMGFKVAKSKKLSLCAHNKNPWYQGFQVINSNRLFGTDIGVYVSVGYLINQLSIKLYLTL